MKVTITSLVFFCVLAGVAESTGSSCDVAWTKAKASANSMLGLAETVWKNVCQIMVNPSCGLRMTVSSGMLHYQYHFHYNSETIDVKDSKNIETQKKCKELAGK